MFLSIDAKWKWPLFGVIVAVALTTAMDATGLSNFSALALLPLLILFWYLQRLSRTSVGFVMGPWRHYVLALLHPLSVIGAVAAMAVAAGAVDLTHIDWGKAWLKCGQIVFATVVVAVFTEEGFFRGWLWASLHQKGAAPRRIVLWTSLAFGLWHLSAVLLDTGFDPPLRQVPVFMVNACILGIVWGLLRGISGSVVVSSFSHGVWNGLAYTFFGFGEKTGALGITNTAVFSPETGVLGLAVNAGFALALWCWWRGTPR